METVTRIINGELICDGEIVTGKSLYYSHKTITAITDKDLPCDNVIDAGGKYVSPGLIDIHVHGGGGFDFMDGGIDPIICAAKMHLKHGTTSIMPTSLACSHPVLKEFLKDLKQVMDKGLSDANILGAHLEGPYFSQAQSGAQNPDYIKAPDPKEYEELIETYGDIINHWSFAPELEGSDKFCEYLVSHNILPSVGHSDAIFADVKKVYDKGCRLVTHLYSGMSTITRKDGYRRLGVVESAYYYDDINAEVIADGKHLPPELLQLIVKSKTPEHICLITDGMRGAGMPDGESLLGRKSEAMPCIIRDGVAKLLDGSAFAGSTATADRLIRTMVEQAEIPIADAVAMMTKTPARIFDLTAKGMLKENYDADIIIFDKAIQVTDVIVGGKKI